MSKRNQMAIELLTRSRDCLGHSPVAGAAELAAEISVWLGDVATDEPSLADLEENGQQLPTEQQRPMFVPETCARCNDERIVKIQGKTAACPACMVTRQYDP